MRRFFVNKPLSLGQRIRLDGDEARHMLNVLRLRRGEQVILINDSGIELTARITETGSDFAILDVIASAPCAAEPGTRVTLFQCVPKAAKLETIIQKCVELGVYDFRPVYSKRCISKPVDRENKLVRYAKVSAEAAKQSGRAVVPRIYPAVKLTECDFKEYDLILIAYEGEEEVSLKSVLRRCAAAERIAMLIGPEGGFEESEVEFMVKHPNAYSVSLGRRILRTETAGMAMLAMLMYELEE